MIFHTFWGFHLQQMQITGLWFCPNKRKYTSGALLLLGTLSHRLQIPSLWHTIITEVKTTAPSNARRKAGENTEYIQTMHLIGQCKKHSYQRAGDHSFSECQFMHFLTVLMYQQQSHLFKRTRNNLL